MKHDHDRDGEPSIVGPLGVSKRQVTAGANALVAIVQELDRDPEFVAEMHARLDRMREGPTRRDN